MAEQLPAPGAQVEPTTYNILFVCTGNTCRSPMAETIARRAVAERGWTHVAVASAGVAAAEGAPASEGATRVAAEAGFDLAGHTARAVTPEMIEWADLILGMGTTHLGAVAALGGAEKVALVTDFLEDDEDAAGQQVEDPFGGDDDSYRRAFEQLRHAIDGVLARLEPILAP